MHEAYLNTPLGTLKAVACANFLHSLQFVDNPAPLAQSLTTYPLERIQSELKLYFEGILRKFLTPIKPHGTPFQKKVWEELVKTEWGITRSYGALAQAIQNPKACRAVASACGANPIVIVIPCHRIVSSSGKIGGYSAGISRKKTFLKLEGTHEPMFWK